MTMSVSSMPTPSSSSPVTGQTTKCVSVLGRQANLRESSESKELAQLRLQVLVAVKANDACDSKKEIMRLRE